MTGILKPPPPEVLESCDHLDELIGELVVAKNAAAATLGKFEAPIEASLQLNLVTRHVEGIASLARHDLVLLPAATVLTRAAFEGGLRSWWLLAPTGDFEREARWLAHLAEEEQMWERLARLARETGQSVGDFSEAAQSIYSFRARLSDKMPLNVPVPVGVPNLRAIAREMREERHYMSYVLLSQYVHGGHFAGSSYRRGLGTLKEFEERASPRAWALCFRISWWSLYRAAQRLVEVAAIPGVILGRPDQFTALENSLARMEAL